jgi:DNA uptake protein ComE-like DNA-binding protein
VALVAARGKSPHTAEDRLIKPADRGSDDPDPDAAPEDFVLDEVEPRPQEEPIEADGEQGRSDAEELPRASRALAEERKRTATLLRRISNLEAELRLQMERADETLARTVKEQEAEFAAALRERDEALRGRETELKQQLSARYEKRKADLSKDLDGRQAELEDQLAALEMRLDVREDELREQAGRREAKLEDRIRELQEQLADAKLGTHEAAASKKHRRLGGSKNGAPDVNEVSFEQLRELGLSVTQSARVIAYRETRGGFDSLDELDEIPGLPKNARETLNALLSI